MKLLSVIRKDKENSVEFIVETIRKGNKRILNIGSSSSSFGENCINLDIRETNGVDVVADAHMLPFGEKAFDICVLCAVLQYCENPCEVAREVGRVLIPGGIAVIDAPFGQQYCLGTPDLYRFSVDGLKAIFGKHLEIVRCDVSFAGGSALEFYLQGIAGVMVSKKYLGLILMEIVS